MNNRKLIKSLAVLFFFLLFCGAVFSQSLPKVNFAGEGNGNEVKLFWLPESWPKELDGFLVKRRAVDANGKKGSWITLTANHVYPESNPQKDLSNVEPSESERKRLQAKLEELIQAKKAKVLMKDAYYDEILKDAEKLQSMAFAFLFDYDIVLLNGFALIDRNIPQAPEYEYGLFPVIKNNASEEPAASFFWKFGTKPSFNLAITKETEITGRKKGILVKWIFDIKEFKDLNLKGFNIYKKQDNTPYEKVNDKVVLIASNENPAFVMHKENFPVGEKSYTYAVAPITMFGTEGDKVEIIFDPSIYTDQLTAPVLKLEEGKGGASLDINWNFNPAQEKFIKGFQVERKIHLDSAYQTLSSLLPSGSRSFEDKNVGKGGYYFYRVTAVQQDKLEVWSNEEVIYFNPKQELSSPENLKGELIKEGGINFVQLTWDKKAAKDANIIGYYLYTINPYDSTLAWEGNIPLITTNEYKYEIKKSRGAAYTFAISAVGKNRAESNPCNPIVVFVPSKNIPDINIWPISKNENVVTLNWQYPEGIRDLAGFRLYQNGTLILDESSLSSNVRQWVSGELQSGIYEYVIEAVTRFGVLSKQSQVRKFNIQ